MEVVLFDILWCFSFFRCSPYITFLYPSLPTDSIHLHPKISSLHEFDFASSNSALA